MAREDKGVALAACSIWNTSTMSTGSGKNSSDYLVSFISRYNTQMLKVVGIFCRAFSRPDLAYRNSTVKTPSGKPMGA